MSESIEVFDVDEGLIPCVLMACPWCGAVPAANEMHLAEGCTVMT
jgi:hypothetical protein